MSETIDTQVSGGDTPDPESQEYIDQMVQRAEGNKPSESEESETESQDTGEDTSEGEGDDQDDGLPRDENGLILGKYKTAADLAKGYQHLSSKLGAPGSDGESDESDSDTSTDDLTLNKGEESGDGEGDDQGGDEPALDFEKYTKEFTEQGELSDDSIQDLESRGISRDMVSMYMRGIQAENEARAQAAEQAVGGSEQFNAIREWAQQNLSDQAQETFNQKVLAAESAEEVALLYETLNTRYTRENGKPAQFVDGDQGATNLAGYTSIDEMKDDMASEKYRKDPAFRKRVQQKIGNSDILPDGPPRL